MRAAALELAQLERIDELIARKRQIFVWYQEALSGVDGITLNYEAPGTKNTYWMVTVIMEPMFSITKDRLMKAIDERGIDCRPFFHPLSSLQAYSGLPQAEIARSRNTHAYKISSCHMVSTFRVVLVWRKSKSFTFRTASRQYYGALLIAKHFAINWA